MALLVVIALLLAGILLKPTPQPVREADYSKELEAIGRELWVICTLVHEAAPPARSVVGQGC